MRRNRLRWLAFGILGLSAALGIISLALVIMAPTSSAAGPGNQPAGLADWLQVLIGIPMVIGFIGVGALLALKQPGNPVGWICAVLGLAIVVPGSPYASYALTRPAPLPGAVFGAWWDQLTTPIAFFLIVFLILLFPDGRLPSARWRPVAWSLAIGAALWTIAFAFGPGFFSNSFTTLRNPFGIEGPIGDIFLAARGTGYLLLAAALLAAAVALISRFRKARGEVRQQLKWLAAAGALLAIAWVIAVVQSLLTGQDLGGLLTVVLLLTAAAIPISIGVSVFRYRLYDIDLVINRALVYGALAILITAVYVGIVVGIGRLIGSGGRNNLALSIFATAVVAVAFQPVRERVQHIANRLVYGKRATPYEVMADFSERMSETLAPDEVLPRMAEAAARGVGAEAAQIALHFADGSKRAVWWPRQHPTASGRHQVPINYHDNLVGEIAVYKAPGASITAAEAKLLAGLAAQAGLVVHNIQLTDELQMRLDELTIQADAVRASRQRLVTVATAERQRLEETIRGGAEHELGVLAAKLSAVGLILDADPPHAGAALEGLTGDVQATLDGLRHLARGVYPPLLRDQGLLAALRSDVSKVGTAVAITSEGLGRYPSEVESAVYFCCLEVLRTNASVGIHLSERDGVLEFSLDSVGGRLGARERDLEDRLEALGGSLTVDGDSISGRVPIHPAEVVA